MKTKQHIHVDLEHGSSCGHAHHFHSEKHDHGLHLYHHNKKNDFEMKEIDINVVGESKINEKLYDHGSNYNCSHPTNNDHCHNSTHKHKKKYASKYKSETGTIDNIKLDAQLDFDTESRIIKEENSDFTEEENSDKGHHRHHHTHECNNYNNNKQLNKHDHTRYEDEKCIENSTVTKNNLLNKDDPIYKIKRNPINKTIEKNTSNSNKSSQIDKNKNIALSLLKNTSNTESDFIIQRTNNKRKSSLQQKSPRLSELRKNLFILCLVKRKHSKLHMIENYIGLGDTTSHHSGDNTFNDSLISNKQGKSNRTRFNNNNNNQMNRKHPNLIDGNPIHNHHHKSYSDIDHRPHNVFKEKSSKGNIILNNDHIDNINVRAAMIHIIGDIIQSIGVIIAAILIYFFPNYQVIDPLMTIFFSVIVIFTTIPIIKQCIIVVMEGTHPDFDLDDIKKLLLEVILAF